MSTSDLRIVIQEVDGKLIVPLHDPVHDRFLEQLRIKVLDHLHREGGSAVIVDMSGVEILDGHDFESLRRVSQALELMGTTVVLAGLRPGVAAGIVMLDLDDSWVRPALSVQQALEALE